VLITIFILVRVLANPLSNLFQKQLTQQSAHPVFIIAAVHASLAVVCLPLCLTPGMLDVSSAVWGNMLISAALAVVSNVTLIYALSGTDLSVLGPINAYKSVVGLILGILVLGEKPTGAGAGGVFLIVAGSYFVIDRRVNQPLSNAFVRFFRERGIQLRFAALFLSATEAIFLKRAILLSSPWPAFVLWSMLGLPIAAAGAVLLLRSELASQVRILRKEFGTFASLAAATAMMQMATLLTFRDLQVGYALALFQLSTLVSVLLGQRYFAERNIRERFIGSLVMAAGAALIVVLGHRR
jgi:drug/metabolite transporter (DMT)-like permease